MGRPHCILYLNTSPGDRIQRMTLAGIRRYAEVRGWQADAIPWKESRPEDIPALLAERRPVVGCVVECADGDSRLTPQFFCNVPTVYLHAAMSFCGGRVARVSADNAAVARAAFRELSVGRPAAYAVVEAAWKLDWSEIRSRTFQALAAKAGMPCPVFAFQEETDAERAARLAGWVAELPCKCAVFAVNDYTAGNVADAARAVHRSIPHELTLLGVDNDVAICEASAPPISSIQLDHERAGFLAAKMLGSILATKNTKKHKDFVNSVSFVAENASVGPLLAVRRKSTGGRGRHEKFVLEAVEIIRREAASGLTAVALSRRFRCSRRLFELRFREAVGHSVLDEIQHVRLERAFALLSQTDTVIGAIADLCGYHSDGALKWIFRKETGMTMSEWRNRNRR